MTAGANAQTRLWAASNAGRQGVAQMNVLSSEVVYGTGVLAKNYAKVMGTAGFAYELFDVGIGGPPAYIPDGLPSSPVFLPFQWGASTAAILNTTPHLVKSLSEEKE